MRFSRLIVLSGAAVALGACSSDNVTTVTPPPLAGVRYVNAVPDTFGVDIRTVDQIQWSATANLLQFRSATEHQPMEAKARKIRVFVQPGADLASPEAVSQVLVDTTITFDANARYTLLLTGSARAKTVKFVVINDAAPVPTAGNVAFRALNANGPGAADTYLASVSGDPLPDTPAFANVAVDAASAYASRAVGAVHARAYDAGNTATVRAQLAGPTRPKADTLPGYRQTAGVDVAGSVFSVVYFPASVAGSKAPQSAAFLNPAIVYLVDRIPGETW